MNIRYPSATIACLLLSLAAPSAHAAGLIASDRSPSDRLGHSVSLSGSTVVAGAPWTDASSGSAYIFRDLDTASGTITESAKLTASDGGTTYDYFGTSVSLSGSTALVGFIGGYTYENIGAAYVFRNLDTATGTITEDVKLIASDRAVGEDTFGNAVSLSGSIAIVGAVDYYPGPGAAYVFRNLDTATGTITEDVKLIASDPSYLLGEPRFGNSVSLSGTTAIVGAYADDQKGADSGSVYVYRNLDIATGTVTEDAKLTASDGAAYDYFGDSVSLSGSTAIVGAYLGDETGGEAGAVYLFRHLDTVIGTVTEDAKLIASDGGRGHHFGSAMNLLGSGSAVSLSGSTALIGAHGDSYDSPHTVQSGAAYLFRNLDTATGIVTESVKLTASDGGQYHRFGASVSLDGDLFVIGAYRQDSYLQGKAYTGSVSSLTTLDEGNASRVISGISFESREDWVIGQTTDNNTVTLSAGDTADITATGKAVYIGQNAGSDDNTLIIAGQLIATEVFIGSIGGSTGNSLVLEATATFDLGSIYLAEGNTLLVSGDHTAGFAGLLASFGGSLFVRANDAWAEVTGANYTGLIGLGFDGGYTFITANAIPEPAIFAALLGAGALAACALRRRRR